VSVRVSAVLALLLSPLVAAEVPIIFDTDFASDCDDAGALAVLHALADAGEARILGTISCTANRWTPAAIDAVNTWYGRPDIPIGTIKGKKEQKHDLSSYTERLARDFPNDTGEADTVRDATEVYRRILAAQQDRSVTIVAVGWMTNLKNLLESGPDEFSRDNGVELVRRKVKALVQMGPKIEPPGKGWNIEQDPESARSVVGSWPTPIVFSPKEICWAMTGGTLPMRTPKSNPVRKAYELWFAKHGRGETTRHSADLTAVLYAVRGSGPYWSVQDQGSIEIDREGHSVWRMERDSPRSYLRKKMEFDELAGILDALIVRPPKHPKGKR
jgi:inosine-uridine nucleoside N-ribohydrolase